MEKSSEKSLEKQCEGYVVEAKQDCAHFKIAHYEHILKILEKEGQCFCESKCQACKQSIKQRMVYNLEKNMFLCKQCSIQSATNSNKQQDNPGIILRLMDGAFYCYYCNKFITNQYICQLQQKFDEANVCFQAVSELKLDFFKQPQVRQDTSNTSEFVKSGLHYGPPQAQESHCKDMFSEELKETTGSQNSRVGYAYDQEMLLHKSDDGKHSERPERILAINYNLLKKNLKQQMRLINFTEVSEDILLLVHSQKYIDVMKKIEKDLEEINKIEKNQEKLISQKMQEVQQLINNNYSFDNYLNQYTKKSAFLSVGAVKQAVDEVCLGNIDCAFCNVRPPGHHSTGKGEGEGFCFFNNVAVATKYAQKQYPNIKKVAIFDWDVHLGDGTMKQFYNDNNVLFISVHRYDNGQFYPGGQQGHFSSIGVSQGKGFNVNIPWNTELPMFSKRISSIGDEEYIYIFSKIVSPIIQEFAPDLLIVSAGFDSGYGDIIGNLNLRPRGYAYMTYKLKKLCPKLIISLEGGYSKNTLALGSEACVRVLLGQPLPYKELEIMDKSFEDIEKNCKPKEYFTKKIELGLILLLKPFWKCMAQLYEKQSEEIKKSLNEQDLLPPKPSSCIIQ